MTKVVAGTVVPFRPSTEELLPIWECDCGSTMTHCALRIGAGGRRACHCCGRQFRIEPLGERAWRVEEVGSELV